MKIICTKDEKEILLEIMEASDNCLITSGVCRGTQYCRECMEENIEWEVTDGS